VEPLGHINLMEIVKVERQSSGAGNKWLIFDQSRKHIETRVEALVSPHIQEALERFPVCLNRWRAGGFPSGGRVGKSLWID
jgi:hypothetical protein